MKTIWTVLFICIAFSILLVVWIGQSPDNTSGVVHKTFENSMKDSRSSIQEPLFAFVCNGDLGELNSEVSKNYQKYIMDNLPSSLDPNLGVRTQINNKLDKISNRLDSVLTQCRPDLSGREVSIIANLQIDSLELLLKEKYIKLGMSQ